MQAAYHGVPIVALPLNADQPDNAAKVVAQVNHPVLSRLQPMGRLLDWNMLSINMACYLRIQHSSAL